MMKVKNLSDCYKLSKVGDIIIMNTERSGRVVGIEPYDKNLLNIIDKKYKVISYTDICDDGWALKKRYGDAILLSNVDCNEKKFWYKEKVLDKENFLFDRLKDFAVNENDPIRNYKNVDDFIDTAIEIICNKSEVRNINKEHAIKTVVQHIIINEPNNFEIISYIISIINLLVSGRLKYIKGEIFKVYEKK